MDRPPCPSIRGLIKLVLAAFATVALASGCGPTHQYSCLDAEEMCGEVCVDVRTNAAHCGGCGLRCGDGAACEAGQCVGEPDLCEAGETESCYFGPAGTEGVGPCRAGTRTCLADGTGWGPCEGMVLPVQEICDNGIDDNCNGVVDEEHDLDGDGWTNCQGDCCDSIADGCSDPHLVNPGAFEVPDNGVDDDCDGIVDNALPTCDAGLASDSGDAMDFARAMGLCQTTELDAPLPERRWGVIEASFSLPSGTGTPRPAQRSIRPRFGTNTPALEGVSMAVLSTGHAAAVGDLAPDYRAFQGGQDMDRSSAVPADWLAANGGDLPNAPGCPAPQGGTTAHDPIMLTLKVRVPTNANSFSLSSNFFSSEYPEWVCSAFNDFFVVLLDSAFAGDPPNPEDKNLAIYTAPNDARYPVGVNLAHGDTGLFGWCLNGPTGCGGGAVAGSTSACQSVTGLAGTGFDVENPPSQFPNDPGWCGDSNLAGGATGWLTTSGNVEPGEIIELRFAIWDTGDPWYDSVVLLDNFRWNVEASEPGTVVD
jgi:hypothetical protein